ncbi:MAG: ABC transporter ATP-binding protein [Pseudomonadota bacterium]
MTSHLTVSDVSIDLGESEIVQDISFSLQTGEIGCLLGPSGCGKTTLLRSIAGFEQPRKGTIELQQQVISSSETMVPPEARQVGMVFQDLALFPHLTVAQNVAFGIKQQPKELQAKRVADLLDLVSLSTASGKYPHELSGGQQQRVALIRAMAPKPRLLLLDEPFSGQDSDLREQLAREVRGILLEDNITALLVTHDQMEAFAFSDSIGVINHGVLQQWDSAFNLYHRPANEFVADFIGSGEFVCGTVSASDSVSTPFGELNGEMTASISQGVKVKLLVRPDEVRYDNNSVTVAKVVGKSFRGADHLYQLETRDGSGLLCLTPSHNNFDIGDAFGFRLELDRLVVFPDSDRAHSISSTAE